MPPGLRATIAGPRPAARKFPERNLVMASFYGLYRGVVASSTDPQLRGRLQIRVPAVAGNDLLWAPILQPFTGGAVAMSAPGTVGASVWVMFESGDASRPVVMGKS
jgi:hypothetical protein